MYKVCDCVSCQEYELEFIDDFQILSKSIYDTTDKSSVLNAPKPLFDENGEYNIDW